MRPPRILIGAILHETNTFNRIPTRLEDFKGRYLALDAGAIRQTMEGTATEIAGFIEAVESRGWEAELAVSAAAGPSGPLDEGDWQLLRNRLLDTKGSYQGVVLALHGAMVTQESDDPEGTLLAELRKQVGDGTPIVVTLDMHANVSPRMLEAADVLIPYETYPHVDHYETGRAAVGVLARLLATQRGSGRLTKSAMVRPPMLDAADHGRTDPPGPMNALIERARALRARPDVVWAGLTIGFPWADVSSAGPAALVSVLADSSTDPVALARPLGTSLWDSRAQTQLDFATPATAIARARQGRPGDAPLVLADFADNPAGGAYGDSPNLLRAMVEADLANAAFASLADPASVRTAIAAGEGQSVRFRLGGRHAPAITPPLEVSAVVDRLHDGRVRLAGPVLRGVQLDMGPMAVLRIGGIRAVLASRALAVTDLNLFRSLGIEPEQLTTIALKSRNHHRAAFGPIARDVLLVDAGGIATMQLRRSAYHRLPRPLWPLDPEADLSHMTIMEFAPHVCPPVQ